MVPMFVKYDANGNGTIDSFECRKLLSDLNIEATAEKVDSVLAMIDKDNSGEISFDEFCHFVHHLKLGDEHLSEFAKLLEKVQLTPLGELERQATLRKLKLTFITINITDNVGCGDPVFVIEVSAVCYKKLLHR
jgi:hypothetical protein